MDNFRTTSSDACFALSRVISDSAQAIYSSRSMSKVVEAIEPASKDDEIAKLKVALGKGN